MASPFVEDLVLWFMHSNPGIDVSLGSAARNIIELAAGCFEQRSMPVIDSMYGCDLTSLVRVNIAPATPLQEIALTLSFVERNAWAMIDSDVDA